MGNQQYALRAAGFRVIGGSPLGDQLENDRGFGQDVLRCCGLDVLPSELFPSPGSAVARIRARPARYVVKWNGASSVSSTTFVGRSSDGADAIACLLRRPSHPQAMIQLSPFVDGVEVGVGAYFNGVRFLRPVCLDWEHKGFFPGNLGEQTGEMGTLVTYEDGERLFEATLARTATLLRDAGHIGYVNLNTIVNEDGVWPLEFTARFGYPGSAILGVLQPAGWADLFQRMLDPTSVSFPARLGYAVGVVLTVPPFPHPYGYDHLGKGSPVIMHGVDARDDLHIHANEVAMRESGLVCAGMIGSPLIVTGSGRDAFEAQADAYTRIAKIVIPDMRYRNDIGTAFIDRDYETLRRLGWMPRHLDPRQMIDRACMHRSGAAL